MEVEQSLDTDEAKKSTRHPYAMDMQVSFSSNRNASVVYNTVSVDEEIRPHRIHRVLSLQENVIHVKFSAAELRFLRVAISSFLEAMKLSSATIQAFEHTAATE